MYLMAELLRVQRLRWSGNVQRQDKDEGTRTLFQMTVDGQRNRSRLVKECMAKNQTTTEMAEDKNIGMRSLIVLLYCRVHTFATPFYTS